MQASWIVSCWRKRLDLRQKIAFVLLGAMFVLGIVVTVPAYFLARSQLLDHAQELLDMRARLEHKELAEKFESMLLIARSLADTMGEHNAKGADRRQQIFDGLLPHQNLAVLGARLLITDDQGRVQVSRGEPGLPPEADELLATVRLGGLARAVILNQGQVDASLLMALPIAGSAAGSSSGAVLLRVPLMALLLSSDPSYLRWLSGTSGVLLAGMKPVGGEFQLVTEITLPAPLAALNLHLGLARDRHTALSDLNTLLALIALVGILIIAGMLVLARFAARFITMPLEDVARAAEEIAASGRPESRLEVVRSDEFGRLASAFNAMVDRISESRNELEQRVAQRTREYEESQRTREIASNLLREAVSSICQGFTIYDQNDRFVVCNEAYLHFYEASRDLIIPGNSFEEIVRRGAERGQYQEAIGRIDDWVSQRVAQHQSANGEVVEQQLGDGRWLLIVEYRTPSGYIVGNRIDITELKQTTERLRQRELYLRATLDNLPFLFWLKDTGSRFLAVNKRFADACGRDDPEMLAGLSDYDVWPADLAEGYRQDDFAVMASGREKALEEPVAGGSASGWIETFKKPVFADDGTVLGTVGFARDISERKAMEQALLEGEQRWALAVKGANDGIWDWNPKTGSVYYSDRWKEILGFTPDELSDSFDEWNSRIHPDDLAATIAALEGHLGGQEAFYQCEYRLRRKDGSYLWVSDRGQAKFDQAGQALRMAGSLTDVTERHEAEAHIHDRNQQLNAIFDLSPDGFVSFDSGFRVKYASPAFLRMSGMEEGEISGLDEASFDERLAKICLEQSTFPGVAALRSHRDSPGDVPLRRQIIELAGPGRHVLEVDLRLAHSETVSQIIYFHDITYESEVDRLKTEFLSTAAHELRTPMASIYGFTELLMNGSFEAVETAEFLDIIYKQSGLMIAIINELLDLSRIEARRGKDFKIEPIDLRVLLNDVVTRFMPPDGRPAPLRPESLPGDEALWIKGDRSKLTQAIGNVLSNAYKYSPDGGSVALALIRAAADDKYPARIGIQVTDQGIGMNASQLARVSERFYRADNSGKIPGTGLGMSIVKEIIELHHGELALTSYPGAGTTVTLWVPARAVGGVSA